MKYKKFDVKTALAGEPVILRDGTKAYVKYQESELVVRCPIIGFDEDGFSHAWDNLGKVIRGTRHSDDIVGMYPKEPLTMPDSFWDVLHPHYNVIAKDSSGTWYAYHEKPEKLGVFWNCSVGDFINLSTVICCSFFPDCNWEDSLILRPTK